MHSREIRAQCVCRPTNKGPLNALFGNEPKNRPNCFCKHSLGQSRTLQDVSQHATFVLNTLATSMWSVKNASLLITLKSREHACT